MISIELNENILLDNRISLDSKGFYVLLHCLAQLNPDMKEYSLKFVQEHTANSLEEAQEAADKLFNRER